MASSCDTVTLETGYVGLGRSETCLAMRHRRLRAADHVPLCLVLELLHALARQAGRLTQVPLPLAWRTAAF
jgi:hypothetical protein